MQARSVGTNISKTDELVKCFRAAVINAYREWITKKKTGPQRQACGRPRLPNAQSEKRIVKIVHSNRRTTVRKIVGNHNQGATTNVSERIIRLP